MKQTITKRDIIRHVTDEMEQLTQKQVEAVIQGTVAYITSNLAKGNEVVIRRFGTFEIRKTKAKVGRNPKVKNSQVVIPPRAVVKFSPGKQLKDKVAQVLPMLD